MPKPTRIDPFGSAAVRRNQIRARILTDLALAALSIALGIAVLHGY